MSVCMHVCIWWGEVLGSHMTHTEQDPPTSASELISHTGPSGFGVYWLYHMPRMQAALGSEERTCGGWGWIRLCW